MTCIHTRILFLCIVFLLSFPSFSFGLFRCNAYLSMKTQLLYTFSRNLNPPIAPLNTASGNSNEKVFVQLPPHYLPPPSFTKFLATLRRCTADVDGYSFAFWNEGSLVVFYVHRGGGSKNSHNKRRIYIIIVPTCAVVKTFFIRVCVYI